MNKMKNEIVAEAIINIKGKVEEFTVDIPRKPVVKQKVLLPVGDYEYDCVVTKVEFDKKAVYTSKLKVYLDCVEKKKR